VKSIALLIERGYTDIDVVGSDGGSTGHVLGGWAALCEAPGGTQIRVHHGDSITHRIHPQDGGTEFDIAEGQEFSVFALSPCRRVHLQGAVWNLDGVPLALSTRGLHNRGIGEVVRISADGILAVIIPRRE
jgi:thiamine pyrophosphokinase